MTIAPWIRVSALLSAILIFIYGSAIAASIWRSPFPNDGLAYLGHHAPVLNEKEAALVRSVRSSIGYPDFLKSGSGMASAVISFHVNHSGEIDLVNASSESGILADYIREKLSGIQLDSHEWAWGRTYHFALQFRLLPA